MMTRRHRQRLMFVVLVAISFATATGLILYSFEQNLLYFHTPSQVAAAEHPLQRNFNLGGMVVAGSVKHEGMSVQFSVTDTLHTLTVIYTGLLPDLFREGQGIVATGAMNEAGMFAASRVLAKHDENYMPPEVAAALQQGGAAPPEINVRHDR